MVFFSEVVLAVTNWAYSQAAAGLVGVVVEEGPAAHVLVAVLHALLPVRAVGAGRHAPLGRAVGVDHRQARLGHVGGEGGVPEDLLRDLALAGTGPASPKVMPVASLGAYFFIQSTYLVSA